MSNLKDTVRLRHILDAAQQVLAFRRIYGDDVNVVRGVSSSRSAVSYAIASNDKFLSA